MKVLVFNGSPRMKSGNSEQIITPLLEGIREGGAEAEVVYLRKLKLHPCIGCLSCWFNTPGICRLKDDVHMLRDKMMESDVFILTTPIYLFSPSGYMKILIERLFFPFTMPEYTLIDGRVYHPIRYPERKWKCLLIANAAFDGQDVFKPLIDAYERMASNVVDNEGKKAFISLGSITIGFGELFADKQVMSGCKVFFDAMRKAGKEIVMSGTITAETLEQANRPLYFYGGMTREQAIDRNNQLIDVYKTKSDLGSYSKN